MKLFLYISLLISATAFAQAPPVSTPSEPINLQEPRPIIYGGIGRLIEESPLQITYSGLKIHSSLKPAIRVHPGLRKKSQLDPLVDLNYLHSNNSNYQQGQYKTGIGVEYNYVQNKKWHLRLAAVYGAYETDSAFAPKSYLTGEIGNFRNYTDIRSRVSFTPNHIFNFQAGLDHNFIGEGLRSMFLNDYGKPYPFGLIRSRFWRLEYSVLYQFMREGEAKDWEGKFASSHHISFNANKWLNIGVFETVIFQPKDTLLNRGFDAEYLNPMVFYRPQEYSLGSSDNVLLGIEVTAKWKKHTAYFQFILDEFFLAEIKARSGWWANKFGGQLGVKGRFKINKNPAEQIRPHYFFYRIETNFSRPFTYSHISDDLNYGHQGMPLAHIYGSNFAEILGELKWSGRKVSAKLFMNYSFHGSDKNGFNYGADIYTPYINRPYELGHFIGNGIQRNFLRAQLRLDYRVSDHGKLNAFIENNYMRDVQAKKNIYTVVVGLRSMLWNDYRNY